MSEELNETSEKPRRTGGKKPPPENMREILNAQKKVKIIISPGHESDSETHAFVGVNGYGFNIKRGVPVEVPEAVIGVLNDAVETRYRTRYDAEGKPYIEPYQVHAYDYREVH